MTWGNLGETQPEAHERRGGEGRPIAEGRENLREEEIQESIGRFLALTSRGL